MSQKSIQSEDFIQLNTYPSFDQDINQFIFPYWEKTSYSLDSKIYAELINNCIKIINMHDKSTSTSHINVKDILGKENIWPTHRTDYLSTIRFLTNKLLMIGDVCGYVYVWNLKEKAVSLDGHHNKAVRHICYSLQGIYVVTATDFDFIIWNGITFQAERRISSKHKINDICFLDKDHVILADRTGIELWRVVNGKLLRKINCGIVYSLTVSSNSKIMISRHETKIKIWDTIKGQIILTINTNKYSRNESKIILSADNQFIIIGNTSNHLINIWNSTSGQLAHELKFVSHEPPNTIIKYTNRMIETNGFHL